MGHLDNSKRVIEVNLTSIGREKLAKGEGLDITQFALSDDEVNYNLWQPDVPEEDRGALIENLPTFEAFTDETQSMRYKLITLEGKSDQIPEISVSSPIQIKNSSVTISPSTVINGEKTSLDQLLGYTAISKTADVNLVVNEEADQNEGTIPALYGEKIKDAGNEAVVGNSFEILNPISNLEEDKQTAVTIVGNETGLTFEITVNIIAV